MSFTGFPKQSVDFLAKLKTNNEKQWFDDNREVYDNFVMEPAREFVAAMGEKLQKIAPKIVADPRINQSIFKIHRDVRFSPDKTPFKTHLGIFFWEGSRKKMENSGFYFHIEPPVLLLGAGIYIFPKSHIDEYRNSVVHPKHGPALTAAIKEVTGNGELALDGKHYKKTPRGFDPAHENAEYLLYDGLSVYLSDPIPHDIFSPGIVDYCFDKFRKMLPLHQWLVKMTERID